MFETLRVYSLVSLAVVVRKTTEVRFQTGESSLVHRESVPPPLSTRVLKCLDLRSERIDYSVHGSSRALHCTMRYVLRCNRGALRHVPRCAHRSRLNARRGNGEGEHD